MERQSPQAAAKARRKRDAPARKRLQAHKAAVASLERDSEATAGTRARLTEAPLARLKRRGALDVWELTAADEIVHAYRTSVGAVATRDPDLGIPASYRPDAADAMAAGRVDKLEKYAQWRRDLYETPALAAAVAVLIDETSMRDTERANRWRNGATTDHLRIALRHFAALRGNTPRNARGWRAVPKGGDPLAEAVALARLVPHPHTVRKNADS